MLYLSLLSPCYATSLVFHQFLDRQGDVAAKKSFDKINSDIKTGSNATTGYQITVIDYPRFDNICAHGFKHW